MTCTVGEWPPVPFDAGAVSITHASLTGVVAGFALLGLVSLARTPSQGSDPDRSAAMLAFLASFLTGSLAAYMYSWNHGAATPNGCPNSVVEYVIFVFPSLVFAIEAMTVFVGIQFLMKQSIDHQRKAWPAVIMAGLVIIVLAVVRLFLDILELAAYLDAGFEGVVTVTALLGLGLAAWIFIPRLVDEENDVDSVAWLAAVAVAGAFVAVVGQAAISATFTFTDTVANDGPSATPEHVWLLIGIPIPFLSIVGAWATRLMMRYRPTDQDPITQTSRHQHSGPAVVTSHNTRLS